MPELPEVETTRRGIAPYLENALIEHVQVRHDRLRWPVSDALKTLRQARVQQVRRRAKYLLIDVLPEGSILLHLGMSGSLRVLPATTPPGKHDHLDLVLQGGKVLRLNDPRRFGAALWVEHPDTHPLLAQLGPEPLSEAFTAEGLWQRSRGRTQAVKTFLMDNHTVVGVGNIYAAESLFLAGIHPARAAGRISRARYETLHAAVRQVLGQAIDAGGTTLRDFTRVDGQPGYFSQALRVYGRAGEPCLTCATPLKGTRQGRRSTVFCPRCQR